MAEVAVAGLARATAHLTAAAVAVGGRVLTPARGVALVAATAIAVLCVAQFTDYREIDAGVRAYDSVRGIEPVAGSAPAPPVHGSVHDPRWAHSWAVLALAGGAAIALGMAMVGRRRGIARLLLLFGAAVVAITLLIDMPRGLDEGTAAIAYESAATKLGAGFWTQLSAGAVLAAAGPLLAGYLRPRRALGVSSPKRRAARALRPRALRPRAQGSGT